MNEKKLFIALIIGTILLLGGSVAVLSSSGTSAITVTQNAKVEIQEKTFDWGQIEYNGPKASKTFVINNSGSETLKLFNIKTSCTCTSAQLITVDKKSPLFAMHGGSSWVGEVAPGKEAKLEIVFDQTFHGPSGVGPIQRFITVETNAADNPKLEFNLKGNVVKN